MIIKKYLIIVLLLILLFCSCHTSIKPENRVLTIAKRSDEAVGAKNNRSSLKYYWKGKLYGDTNSFDARYSKQYDYFLIYIDKTNPYNWDSYGRGDNGYSDTSFIPDSIQQKLNIDSIDFSLLEQEH